LELALDNLPNFPVVAVDDVDIAWQLLVNSWPEQMKAAPTTENSSATQIPTGEVIPTVTPGS
jgi:hypothetical protein